MKLTAIFLMTAFLQVSATGYSQKITLNGRNIPIEKVFREISRQTGFEFFYNVKDLPPGIEVDMDVQNGTLQETLDMCLKQLPLSYTLSGKYIVINPRPHLLPSANVPVSSVVHEIVGYVTDENEQPLAGVTVQLKKDRNSSTATDENGHFHLSVKEESDVFIFSFVGFVTKELPVPKVDFIKVRLLRAISVLNDVQIIGYGTTTRRASTGAIGSITSADLGKQPVENVFDALPGRIPGVLVTQNNGLPGSNVVIQIRGQNSLASGTIPLYVIDGVPYTNFNGGEPPSDDLNAFGVYAANGGVSPLSSINPADIERIDILKDADATAIYGSRGANGVVLITTKRGKTGKAKLDLNVYQGQGTVSHFIPMLNTQQYLALRREAFKNDGIDPATSPDVPVDLLNWDQNAYTDWQRKFLGGTSHITDAQASFSGGDQNTHYLVNAAYRKDGTVYPGDWGNKRFSGRISLDHNSTDKKLNFSLSASYSVNNTDLPSGNPSELSYGDLSQLYTLAPNLPLYNPDGSMYWTNGITNPLSYLMQPYKGNTTNLMTNSVIRYTILPGLNLKANIGYNTSLLTQTDIYPAIAANPAYNPVSSASFATNKAENYIVEPTADYTRSISKGKLNIVAGASWQKNSYNALSIFASNYSSDALLNSLAGAGVVTASPSASVYKYDAVFGRVNYDWDGKYVVDGTFRRDGSSRFGPANRFGNFGAVGAAWIFSGESFIKNALSFLSYGKLRGSYGTTGNDQIPNYIYVPLYTPNRTPYQTQTGLSLSTLPNPDIKWESTRKLDLAIELGFLKDRILLTADYYQNRSGNQLLASSLPTQSGFNSYTTNLPAFIQNNGWEVALNTTNITTTNFSWKTTFNVTIPRSKLLKFPGIENSYYSDSYVIGQPINFTKAFHYTGADPATGGPTFEDVNKDGVIDYTNDRIILPVGHPFYGGLSNNFSYKGWQLDVFLQFTHQNDYTNDISQLYTPPGSSISNQNTSVLSRWRQSGDVHTIWPAATSTPGSSIYNAYGYNFGSSDIFWGNASFLKLRSVNLSYSFPKAWINHLSMSGCKLFIQGQNIFTWAENKYVYDTETSVSGGPPGPGTGRYAATPPLRTIVIGLNCSF